MWRLKRRTLVSKQIWPSRRQHEPKTTFKLFLDFYIDGFSQHNLDRKNALECYKIEISKPPLLLCSFWSWFERIPNLTPILTSPMKSIFSLQISFRVNNKHAWYGYPSRQISISKWCVGRCGSKNKHQEDMRFLNIVLHTQNVLAIIGSIVNTIGVNYMIVILKRSCTLQ